MSIGTPVHLTEMVSRDEYVVAGEGPDRVIFMHPLMWVQAKSDTREKRWAGILEHINQKIKEQADAAEERVMAATEPNVFMTRITVRAILRDIDRAEVTA